MLHGGVNGVLSGVTRELHPQVGPAMRSRTGCRGQHKPGTNDDTTAEQFGSFGLRVISVTLLIILTKRKRFFC